MVCVRGSVVLLTVVGVACTVSNPAFDVDDTTGAAEEDDDRGEVEDDSAASTNASGESEAGSVEGSSGDDSSLETTEGEEVGSDEATFECPGMVEYDWEVALLDDGDPLPDFDCGPPFFAEGPVINAVDGSVVFGPCNGCDCVPNNALEVQMPGLLRGSDFPVGSCVRIEIDWSEAEWCRPVGFVASSDRIQPMRPVAIAGQDIPVLPQTLGGETIGLSTVEPCRCPECCDKSGVAALDFGSGGGPIREGESSEVQGLAGSERTWQVTVHEAHVHDDCTRGIAWTALVDEK